MAATTWARSPLGSYLGDMAVRKPDRGLVFERVACFYCSQRVTFPVDCVKCVNSHNKSRMTHRLQVAKNCTTHPLPRVQKLMTQPLSALAHPPPHTFWPVPYEDFWIAVFQSGVRLASVEKNCCLLKVLPNRLHPTPTKKPSISIVWSLYWKLKCCSLETVTSQISTMLEPVVQASFQSILFTIHDLILRHKVYRGLTDLINKIGSTDLIRSHKSWKR